MLRYLSLLSVLGLVGCQSFFGPKSLDIGDNKGTDKIVLTTAKERAITYIAVDQPKDDKIRRVSPKRVVCAEPSPDVATAVSDAITASFKASGSYQQVQAGAEGSFNRSVTESIAQLGSRLATIQLLRDELSDLCRAYANGAVSSITYTLRLSRLDKKMITLLIGEASAGALSRALIGISSTSSAGGDGRPDPDKLDKANQRIEDAASSLTKATAELKAAEDARTKETNAAKIPDLEKNVAAARDTLRKRLAELTDRMLEKLALETHGSGVLATSTLSALAGLPSTNQIQPIDLGKIHKSYLENDDLGTLIDACLTSLEENFQQPIPSPALDEVNKQILDKRKKLPELKRKAQEAFEAKRQAARASQSQSPNAPPLILSTPEDDAVQALEIELEALNKQSEELGGQGAGSGLATFCRRQGMASIIQAMVQKIQAKAALDASIVAADLCRTALGSERPDAVALQRCMDGFYTSVRAGEGPYFPPSINR